MPGTSILGRTVPRVFGRIPKGRIPRSATAVGFAPHLHVNDTPFGIEYELGIVGVSDGPFEIVVHVVGEPWDLSLQALPSFADVHQPFFKRERFDDTVVLRVRECSIDIVELDPLRCVVPMNCFDTGIAAQECRARQTPGDEHCVMSLELFG